MDTDPAKLHSFWRESPAFYLYFMHKFSIHFFKFMQFHFSSTPSSLWRYERDLCSQGNNP